MHFTDESRNGSRTLLTSTPRFARGKSERRFRSKTGDTIARSEHFPTVNFVEKLVISGIAVRLMKSLNDLGGSNGF